jgi:ATP:corrinoid adenosyltransferase
MAKITRLEPEKKKGLVVVITGHGKGKTTTALGIAVRACGHNIPTCAQHPDLHHSVHEGGHICGGMGWN